ncbi:hypothetical protein J3E71DRAFT_393969 [Bipolaris maydis]|nr:hypothetical protein J3E71DRAFT_393969 [Bipolaris maydis]
MAQRPVVDVDGCRGRGQAATIAVLPASGAWHLGSSCGACAPVRIWGWFFDLALDATLLRFHSSMEPPLEGRSCASPRAPTNTDLHAHTRRPNCHGDALGPTVHSSTTTATTVERLARRPRCRPQLAHLVRVVRRLCLEGAAKRANQTLCPPSGLARHYRSVSSCGFREARAGTATTNMQSVSEVSVDSPLGGRQRRAPEWARVHHRAAALEAFQPKVAAFARAGKNSASDVDTRASPLPSRFRWARCDSGGCALIGPQPLAKTGRVLWLWSCGCSLRFVLVHSKTTTSACVASIPLRWRPAGSNNARAPYFISEFSLAKTGSKKYMPLHFLRPEESTPSGPGAKPTSLSIVTPRGAHALSYLGSRPAHGIDRQPLLPCICMVAQQTGGAESRPNTPTLHSAPTNCYCERACVCTRVVWMDAARLLNAPGKHLLPTNADPPLTRTRNLTYHIAQTINRMTTDSQQPPTRASLTTNQSCGKANPSSSAAPSPHEKKQSIVAPAHREGKKNTAKPLPSKNRSIDRLHTCKPVPKTKSQHIKTK